MLSNGTWFALDTFNLSCSMVLNRNEKNPNLPANNKSRGLLPLSLLENDFSFEQNLSFYKPFNLVSMNVHTITWRKYDGIEYETQTVADAGVYVINSAGLNKALTNGRQKRWHPIFSNKRLPEIDSGASPRRCWGDILDILSDSESKGDCKEDLNIRYLSDFPGYRTVSGTIVAISNSNGYRLDYSDNPSDVNSWLEIKKSQS